MIIPQTNGRHFAIFDAHVPHHNPLDEALSFIHETGCTDMVIGGDFLDCGWSSHWNEAIFSELGHGKLRDMFFQEMGAGKKFISEIRKAIGPKARLWYIPGNHEAWLWYAVWNHRFIAPPVSVDPKKVHFKSDVAELMNHGLAQLLSTHLDAKSVSMHVLDYFEPLQLGKVVYLHGNQFGGASPVVTSARRWPHVNLVFGHHHSHQVNTIYNGGDPKQVFQHVMCPGMTNLGPGYLKDKATRWLNGMWVCDVKSGFFDGRVIKIFDGKIITRNK